MACEEMKDSGIPWIGNIPLNWKMIPLKYVAFCNKDTIPEGEDDSYKFDYIDIGSVEQYKGIIHLEEMYFKNAPSRARRIVHPDDVIISTVRTYLRAIAMIDEFEKPQIASTGFAVLTARNILPKYLYYSLLSENFICMVEANSVGISYPAINTSELVKIKIPVPDTLSQTAIASYLDYKCKKIDAIIAEATASIEDYKRWKASMIYQAVTKGLNPNADMRESGIDIVGIVPTDWQMVRLRFLCNVMTGDQDTQNAVPDGNYPFYVRSPIVERADTFTFEGESVLMAGDGVGAGKVFHHAKGKYAIHQRVYCFYNFRNIKPSFFYYYMSNLFSTEIDKGSAKSTVPSVRLPMLSNFRIALPSIQEQDAICEYLDKRTGQIDAIIAEKQSIITELEAYKKSLIYETVTGKRKAE